MIHPDIQTFLIHDRIETLRNAAQSTARGPGVARVEDLSRIELRFCRAGDELALEELAALNELDTVPGGRMVIAEVDGRVTAALPLAGGSMLADPFVRTAHLRRLLELRAAQLREPARRRGLLPRLVPWNA
jgi:hypothetical protein